MKIKSHNILSKCDKLTQILPVIPKKEKSHFECFQLFICKPGCLMCKDDIFLLLNIKWNLIKMNFFPPPTFNATQCISHYIHVENKIMALIEFTRIDSNLNWHCYHISYDVHWALALHILKVCMQIYGDCQDHVLTKQKMNLNLIK